MSKNKSVFVSLLLILALGIIYFIGAYRLPEPFDPNSYGSGYFPKILGVILIGLCLINMWQIRKEEDKKVDMPQMKKIVYTILLTLLYLLVWHYIGYFYVVTFIFLFVLFTYYSTDRSKKGLALIGVITACAIIFLYLVFERLLNINF